MERIIRNVLIAFIAVIFILTACKSKQKISSDYVYGMHPRIMYYAINGEFNRRQLDSIALAESISSELGKWRSMGYIDYDSDRIAHQYIYIKSLEYESEEIFIIRLEIDRYRNDTIFHVTKRITELVK